MFVSTSGNVTVGRSNGGCNSFLLGAVSNVGSRFDTSRLGLLGRNTRRVGRVRKGLAILRRGFPKYKRGPSSKSVDIPTRGNGPVRGSGLVGFPAFSNGSLSKGRIGDDALFTGGAIAMMGF